MEIYFGKYLPQLFYSLLAPVTLFAVLSNVSVKASAVFLLCVPLIPLSIVVVQKIAKKLLDKYCERVYRTGRQFPGEFAGTDDAENLSGR